MSDKPLADAQRRLRDHTREQRRREAEYTAQPPSLTAAAEYVAALRASRNERTKAVEALRAQFERAVGVSTTADLRRLEAALSLYARSLERR